MVRMIAAWGSPGSGKSTFSIALATQLSFYSKNTLIISANGSVPALPQFLPNSHIDSKHSLGALIFSPLQNYNALKGYVHIHPQSDRIGIMGLASGETPISYNAFTRPTMMSLLKLLNDSPFDYIIFDCYENPVYDNMTVLALQTSEYPIRMLTPDVRGIEFEKSQTNWMSNASDMRVDKQIRIISPIQTYSPYEKVESVIGRGEYNLPFSVDVYSKSIGGELITGCKDYYGIQYEKQIKTLAERIVADE